MPINLDELLIHLIVNVIIIAPVLWLAGRALEGKQKAKFSHAVWIAALGTLIGDFLGYFFTGLVAEMIVVIVWLGLIKHFFKCGWLKALLTAIVAIIIFIIVTAILALVGLVTLGGLLPHIG